MAKERTSNLKDVSMKTSITKIQTEKRMKKMEQNIQELWENNRVVYVQWEYQKGKKQKVQREEKGS